MEETSKFKMALKRLAAYFIDAFTILIPLTLITNLGFSNVITRVILVLVAVGVATHIIRIKTFREIQKEVGK